MTDKKPTKKEIEALQAQIEAYQARKDEGLIRVSDSMSADIQKFFSIPQDSFD